MLERILVPTDGSTSARRAERLATEIAAGCGAGIVFVHALVDQPAAYELEGVAESFRALAPHGLAGPLTLDNLAGWVRELTGDGDVASPTDALRALGGYALGAAADRAREAGVRDVETRLIEGVPSRAIVELAGDLDVDLIVMGTRGLGGLRGRLMGSCSERVMRHTRHNTLVVKHD